MSLSRAVTHTVPPLAEVTTRTGLQPASTLDTTECAGSVSALYRLITDSDPWAPPAAPGPFRWGRFTSLVAYSPSPSGATAIPTGAIPMGMFPTNQKCGNGSPARAAG